VRRLHVCLWQAVRGRTEARAQQACPRFRARHARNREGEVVRRQRVTARGREERAGSSGMPVEGERQKKAKQQCCRHDRAAVEGVAKW